jgi:hypothetical protein
VIIPTWSSCRSEISLNGGPPSKGTCPVGWGAAIIVIPRTDGTLLVRMPGKETAGGVDEPGTVVMRPER